MTAPVTTTPVLDVHHFTAPAVAPLPTGLYAATDWQASGRFFNGVSIKPQNYGGELAFGVWNAPWCSVPPLYDPEADPGEPGSERKHGVRPDVLDPFEPMTVWAYDECDLRLPTRAEVEARAAQILRLEEQTAVEREFATRLLDDAGSPVVKPNLRAAVGYLEGEAAKANTAVWFHVGAQWAAREMGLFVRAGTQWTSPLGHTWVIGGGYVEGLVNTIVATSQPFGWRNQPEVRTGIAERNNRYFAIAERTVSIGYEALVAAVQVAP
ncbi:hypothetical protein MTY66_50790 [Mycolicibacterium sp. TY66]|uniref:hypothetical protein n=1 Tax=unclassified Mycolicibacterium TaxID=2636767 RepID=UPI001BB3CA21|nr:MULTISPECIES: hypothetical protein [unclassified Mycolicibacterium]BCI83454.1 hypothetical protein MTY66_50790 [Mycolicibacterium sp. TY66]BCJ78902.1 hypothetical protein MTY81_02750 [Mycolicibacterium sp. TY81]